MDRNVRVLAAAVGAALLAHAVHGVVHGLIPVPTRGWRLAYVVAIVFAAPVAGVLVARRNVGAGAALVVLAGVAGLGFEATFHFAVPNPDHVGHVGRGWLPFALTAALSTVGNLVAAAAGALVWWRTDPL